MRTVRVLVYAQAALLDIALALRVFQAAAGETRGGRPSTLYDVRLVSIGGGQAQTDAGVLVQTGRARVESLDTLLLPGGSEDAVEGALETTRIVKYLREQVRVTDRLAATGAGALLLARAGLIDGKRVSAEASEALREVSTLTPIRDKPYIVDGRLWTSAGALQARSMILAMVAHDLGQSAADAIAETLDPSSERQAAADPIPAAEPADPDLAHFFALRHWIDENPAHDLSTVALAQRSALSVRSLHRRFVLLTGQTPAKYVEGARVRAAQRLLNATRMTLQAVAAACGFGSTAVMHGAFKRQTGQPASRARTK